MSPWKKVSLPEVCQIKPPKKAAKKNLSDTDLVSFVPMKNLGIAVRQVDLNEERPLKKVYGSYTYFADNDVLLAKITPCFENGKLGIVRGLTNGVGFGSSEYIVFRSKGDIIPEYLLYFLSQDSFRYAGAQAMTGAVGHKRVSKEFIENQLIPLPPLSEQQRIVSILDEVFEGIGKAVANVERNIENSRELFESYADRIFLLKGPEWVNTKINKICDKVEYGSSSKSQKAGSVPVLRMGNIQGGEFEWDKLVYTDNTDEIKKYLLKKNDVLFNRTNSAELVGKTAIFRGDRKAIFAGYLIRIHRKEDLINAEFLNYYLNSSPARDYGKSVMSCSVNQANINGTKLKQYPISIPSLSEQQKLVAKFNALKEKSQVLETIYHQKLKKLEELKQSILQKAFTGELTAKTVDKIMEPV